jgi:hypothetical protein
MKEINLSQKANATNPWQLASQNVAVLDRGNVPYLSISGGRIEETAMPQTSNALSGRVEPVYK